MNMHAKVTSEHRAAAAKLLGYFETEAFVASGIANGFADGSTFSLVAEALALAEVRGRDAERARCVEIASREAGHAPEGPVQDALFGMVAMLGNEQTDAVMRERFKGEEA